MAAEVCSPTGYQQVNNSDGSYSGNVSVPSDCDFAVMVFEGYATSALTVTTCTLGGNAMSAVVSRNTANETQSWCYVLPNPPTGTQNFTINHSGSFYAGGVGIFVWCKGIASTSYTRDSEAGYAGTSAANLTFNHSGLTVGDLGIFIGGGDSGTAYNVDLQSQTKLIETSAYNNGLLGAAYKLATAATMTMQGYGAYNGGASIVLVPAAGTTYQETASDGFKGGESLARILTALESASDGVKASDAAITAYLIQHSFRFRNDDADEDEATWKADLNSNLNLGADNTFRLRYLINALNDPASKQFQIEYRRKPSGGAFGPWKQIN